MTVITSDFFHPRKLNTAAFAVGIALIVVSAFTMMSNLVVDTDGAVTGFQMENTSQAYTYKQPVSR